ALLRQLLGQENGRRCPDEGRNGDSRGDRNVETYLQPSYIEPVARIPSLGPIDPISTPPDSKPNPWIQTLARQKVIIALTTGCGTPIVERLPRRVACREPCARGIDADQEIGIDPPTEIQLQGGSWAAAVRQRRYVLSHVPHALAVTGGDRGLECIVQPAGLLR